MRLFGRLSVMAAITAPCMWFASCVNAQDAAGSATQQRTDVDATPGEGDGSGNTGQAFLESPLSADSSCRPSVLNNRTIDLSRYIFGCVEIEAMLAGPRQYLADGHAREVFLVDYKGEQLVLKVTKRQSPKRSARHLKEARALDVVLGAPYIAPTLGFCGTSSVQPFFARGTVEGHIFSAIWTRKPIGLPTVLQMSLDAMRGLQVLHEAPGGPIIHNAMRPEQLLVYGNGTVVVSDLNSCNFMGASRSGEPCPARCDVLHNARWNAPELYDEEGYTEKIDIFSMGIIFWQLMALSSIPYEGLQTHEIPGVVKDNQRPFVHDSWDPSYAQLLQDMWQTDPKARPSSRQVVARLEEMVR